MWFFCILLSLAAHAFAEDAFPEAKAVSTVDEEDAVLANNYWHHQSYHYNDNDEEKKNLYEENRQWIKRQPLPPVYQGGCTECSEGSCQRWLPPSDEYKSDYYRAYPE